MNFIAIEQAIAVDIGISRRRSIAIFIQIDQFIEIRILGRVVTQGV